MRMKLICCKLSYRNCVVVLKLVWGEAGMKGGDVCTVLEYTVLVILAHADPLYFQRTNAWILSVVR